MIENFTMKNAQKLFTVTEIFAIRKETKDMSANEIFGYLSVKTDETGDNRYVELARTMIVTVSI